MKIDSHQHFWHFTEKDYGWIDPSQQIIRRDFLPVDLNPILQANNLDGCVAVQARQSDIETKWLLELASANDTIKGVVGWIDIAADDLDDQLAQYSDAKKLKGFRHVLQDETEPGFMLRPEFIRGLNTLQKHNYKYDLLIFSHQLVEAHSLVKQLPELSIVVDHIAKPEIATGENFSQWASNIRSLSAYPNVMCKVSGMVTEADLENWQPKDFYPYLDVIFEAFGPGRVMFGSDWPVCLLGGSYDSIKQIVSDYVENKYQHHFDQVFGNNAALFYQL
jgi:L-fuconolactonase